MQRFTPPASLTDGLVTLSPWCDSDADALVRRINDPDVALFLDLVPQPYTRADARDWFAMTAEGWLHTRGRASRAALQCARRKTGRLRDLVAAARGAVSGDANHRLWTSIARSTAS